VVLTELLQDRARRQRPKFNVIAVRQDDPSAGLPGALATDVRMMDVNGTPIMPADPCFGDFNSAAGIRCRTGIIDRTNWGPPFNGAQGLRDPQNGPHEAPHGDYQHLYGSACDSR